MLSPMGTSVSMPCGRIIPNAFGIFSGTPCMSSHRWEARVARAGKSMRLKPLVNHTAMSRTSTSPKESAAVKTNSTMPCSQSGIGAEYRDVEELLFIVLPSCHETCQRV